MVIGSAGALAGRLPSQPQPIAPQRKRYRSTSMLRNRSTVLRRTRCAIPPQRGHRRSSEWYIGPTVLGTARFDCTASGEFTSPTGRSYSQMRRAIARPAREATQNSRGGSFP
jgi:hypothetical protein